jgi:Family of unknown function (DUF6152)
MKNSLCGTAVAFFALLVLAIPVFAHHSFQAEFDGSKVIYVTGTLTRFDWENPHMYFYVDVKDAGGKVTSWVIEGASPNAVKRTGTTRQDFLDSVGKTITARACPAKNGTPRAAAETIKVPDGRDLVVGGKRYSGEDGGKSEY